MQFPVAFSRVWVWRGRDWVRKEGLAVAMDAGTCGGQGRITMTAYTEFLPCGKSGAEHFT